MPYCDLLLMNVIILNTPDDTVNFAHTFAKQLKVGDFLAFYGDLGAGKTSFIHGICDVLCPNASVSSPTYTIVNEYEADGFTFCHFDMYRIQSEDDLESIGFWDYSNCIKAVEWAENIPFALPLHYYKIIIEKTEDNKRKLTIEEI